MIVGIGIDLVDSRRIKKLMGNYEARFIERYFTSAEASYIQKNIDIDGRALSLSKRFAAKEACAKALGTGFREGMYMKDIGIENDENGKPFLFLSGGALKQLNRITPQGKKPSLHVSLTDEPPYAQAQVIIDMI